GNTTLRGFGVENYATSLPQMGVVYIGGSVGGQILQNLVIAHNASNGIAGHSPNILVDHVTAQYNGFTGIGANKSNGYTVQNSLVDSNNGEHFNLEPSASGMKITTSQGVTVRDNVVTNNTAAGGIWLDSDCQDAQITGNTLTGDAESNGIMVELTSHAIVA